MESTVEMQRSSHAPVRSTLHRSALWTSSHKVQVDLPNRDRRRRAAWLRGCRVSQAVLTIWWMKLTADSTRVRSAVSSVMLKRPA